MIDTSSHGSESEEDIESPPCPEGGFNLNLLADMCLKRSREDSDSDEEEEEEQDDDDIKLVPVSRRRLSKSARHMSPEDEADLLLRIEEQCRVETAQVFEADDDTEAMDEAEPGQENAAILDSKAAMMMSSVTAGGGNGEEVEAGEGQQAHLVQVKEEEEEHALGVSPEYFLQKELVHEALVNNEEEPDGEAVERVVEPKAEAPKVGIKEEEPELQPSGIPLDFLQHHQNEEPLGTTLSYCYEDTCMDSVDAFFPEVQAPSLYDTAVTMEVMEVDLPLMDTRASTSEVPFAEDYMEYEYTTKNTPIQAFSMPIIESRVSAAPSTAAAWVAGIIASPREEVCMDMEIEEAKVKDAHVTMCNTYESKVMSTFHCASYGAVPALPAVMTQTPYQQQVNNKAPCSFGPSPISNLLQPDSESSFEEGEIRENEGNLLQGEEDIVSIGTAIADAPNGTGSSGSSAQRDGFVNQTTASPSRENDIVILIDDAIELKGINSPPLWNFPLPDCELVVNSEDKELMEEEEKEELMEEEEELMEEEEEEIYVPASLASLQVSVALLEEEEGELELMEEEEEQLELELMEEEEEAADICSYQETCLDSVDAFVSEVQAPSLYDTAVNMEVDLPLMDTRASTSEAPPATAAAAAAAAAAEEVLGRYDDSWFGTASNTTSVVRGVQQRVKVKKNPPAIGFRFFSRIKQTMQSVRSVLL